MFVFEHPVGGEGPEIGIQWEYNGNTMGIQWEYNGNTIGGYTVNGGTTR